MGKQDQGVYSLYINERFDEKFFSKLKPATSQHYLCMNGSTFHVVHCAVCYNLVQLPVIAAYEAALIPATRPQLKQCGVHTIYYQNHTLLISYVLSTLQFYN